MQGIGFCADRQHAGAVLDDAGQTAHSPRWAGCWVVRDGVGGAGSAL